MAAEPVRLVLAAGRVASRGVTVTGRRVIRTRPGRAYLAVRGLDGPRGQEEARAVERALRRVRGVRWAQVNPVLASVAVSFDDGRVNLGDLAGIVGAVEKAHGAASYPDPEDVPSHPADTVPISRALTALGGDLVGAVLAGAGALARVPPLPVELSSALSGVQSLSWVRRALDAHPRAATATAVASAALQGLGQGPAGLVVDGTHRASMVGELVARRKAWLRSEERLCDGRPCQLLPGDAADRPEPPPPTLVERYADASSGAAVGAAGLSLALSGDPRLAADILLAGVPRAATLGVEAFAAQLDRALSARGAVVMDVAVLRRLDVVDTVVVDSAALATGGWEPSAVEVLDSVGSDVAQAAVAGLLAGVEPAEAPDTETSGGGWALAPLRSRQATSGGPVWSRGGRGAARRMGSRVSALSRGGKVVALVGWRRQLHPAAGALIESVRAAAQDLVLAGPGSGFAKLVEPDLTVPGGRDLARSVRNLQAEGRVVALVSSRAGPALRAADFGVGVLEPGGDPPWGADIICPDLRLAPPVVDATRLARSAARQSVACAAIGSAAGGVMALGRQDGAGRRAVTAVHLSALAAMGAGVWTAGRLASPPPVEGPGDRPAVAWHALEVGEALRRTGSSPGGLSAEEASSRSAPDTTHESPGFTRLVTRELVNPLTGVLAAGAALSAAVGSLVDAGLISGVIALDAVIGAAQRTRTEAAIAELGKALAERQVTVLRGGERSVVASGALVTGDVLELSAGDAVPADCRIVGAAGLEVDESALTGESLPVGKEAEPVAPGSAVADRRSMLYAGTSIAAGRATALVVATGAGTEAGKGSAEPAAHSTGVQSRLEALTHRTVPVVLAAGAGLTANSLLRGVPLREAVTSGVSLGTSAVPEGLPFVATVAQAAAAHRLAAGDVLVRNPAVLEALGRVDVLCFDKTGTLTEGRLEVSHVSDGSGDRPVSDLDEARRYVLAGALRATPRARPDGLPHPTDQAVVEGAGKAGVGLDHGVAGWQKEGSLPFEPGRGYHAVTARTPGGALLSLKGAPEVLLPRCSRWRRLGGDAVDLGRRARSQVEREAERLASRGLRVLAVAERRAASPVAADDDEVAGLDLLGFVGVSDEARSSAVEPLRRLQEAGIQVVMITGDHPATAEAVGDVLGLVNGRGVVTGPEMESLDDEGLDAAVEHAAVFARVTPADKVRIVSAFQRGRRIVAMTGDGANDAQAIRLAQVGVAFGSRSTPAAQAAADIVIARDDLRALMDTMVEGRAMWASVRDALSILLGGNLGEVLFATGASLITGRSPLTPRQLLTVNLFTDLAPALAIAVQRPVSGRVQLGREGPETSLSGRLARDVALRAAATSAGAYAGWVAGRMTGTAERARTVALASLVGSQLGQTMVIGRRSPVVLATSLMSAAGLAAVIQTPGVSGFFGCRPLGLVGWGIAIGASGAATLAGAVADAVVP